MMIASPDLLPLADLVDQIENLCAQGKSGTILLISDDNRMAQVHLQQGQISFVLCRGRRGGDALEIMRTMQHARMNLDSTGAERTGGTGYSTATVLAYLRGSIDALPANATLTPSPAAPAPQPAPTVARAAAVAAPAAAPVAAAVAPAAPVAAPRAADVTPAIKQWLQATMLHYIGPMAEIVCGEHFDSAPNLRALAIALAAEIPGSNQREEFKGKVAAALGIAPF